MTKDKATTRERILAAAEEHSRQHGPAALSLEAVAAKAGISKGGLLYHFPSKNKLLTALVEDFMHRSDKALGDGCGPGPQNSVIAAYVRHFVEERQKGLPPPSGVLAALVDNPNLLDPIRRHERRALERIRENASDPQLATIAFLLIHAMRNMELLDMRLLSEDEMRSALDYVLAKLGVSACPDAVDQNEA